MSTFATIVATTSATTVSALPAAATYGVTVKNHPSNAADCIIRVANISTGISTQGYPLSLGQETFISPYECSASAGPTANSVWVYASTTNQSVSVRY